MKKDLSGMTLKTCMTFSFAMIVHALLMAQDGGGSGSGGGVAETTTSITRTETTTSNWYASPWVWVVGIAVFVLLLVALMRGGGSDRTVSSHTDRVTVTKSSSTDL
ncbi:hypothetical protein [Aridibaculum aurantiacum]|uniref:hypothetical protein n=1 Tax=Aridibaculum aurantiacum TaxID=2810307 RepID=UPI001A95D720|nr:hypothetical protein [Aridibaculum aurantiacum]